MDSYIYIITALMPLTASMLVFQVNPYHALVIRGILGAVSALTYSILGAADVALTEALVGTLLAITLYAVAVRSSLVLRLGVLKDVAELAANTNPTETSHHFQQLLDSLRTVFGKHHMRIELVPYGDRTDLQEALLEKEVHATWLPAIATTEPASDPGEPSYRYQMTVRLGRLYEIMQAELVAPLTRLVDSSPTNTKGRSA